MSKSKKSPRDKSPSAIARNGTSPDGKKQTSKKELKQKSVAAEIGGTVKCEEAAAPTQKPSAPEAVRPAQAPAKPAPPAAKPARATKPETAKPAQTVVKAPPAPAKPAAKREPAAATPAPKPAPAAKPAATAPAPQPSQYGLENVVETFERTFKEARRGTIAVNRKLIAFAQANLNSSLDHAKDLAAARSPVRIMRLQMEYWHDCLETFASQAQELSALSTELVAKTSEPIRQQLRGLPPRAA
jgi:chemotaxis protein histidine kinase CheA